MIVFDHDIFTIQRYGGISRYFVELMRQFNSRNIDYKLIAGLTQNKYLLESLKFNGFNIDYPKGTGRLISKINDINFIYQNKNLQPDIIHSTYYRSFLSAKSKTVITAYDFTHERYPKYFSDHTKILNRKQKAINSADGIICISKSTESDLREFYDVEHKNIQTIHLGLSDLNTMQKRSFAKQKQYFLFVGDRSGYKNFDMLLNCFYKMKDYFDTVELICFGGGQLKGRELTKIATIQKIGGVVKHFTGSDKTLSDLYQSALCLIYPSLYEGFGLPIIEAFNHRCPVILGNTSSMPEVGGELADYIDPNSESELYKSMVYYAENGFKSLDAQVVNTHLKKFSMSYCAQKTLDFYERL